MPPKKRKVYNRTATGRPSRRDARNMQLADCPARGRHEKDCICKGTGKVPVTPPK